MYSLYVVFGTAGWMIAQEGEKRGNIAHASHLHVLRWFSRRTPGCAAFFGSDSR